MYTQIAIITGTAITMSTLKSNDAPFAVSVMRPGGTCGPTNFIQITSNAIDSTAQIPTIRHQCEASPEPLGGLSTGSVVMRPS